MKPTWTQEWAELIAPDGQTWWIDVPFLLSNWQCIYGQGCKGVFNAEEHIGCCDIGVDFDDWNDKDIRNIDRRVKQMDDSEFTNAKQVRERWLVSKGNVPKTRVYNGACVFLNAPDHPNGAGCSLHQAALKRGEDPKLWKPLVCSWTVLFMMTDVDHPLDSERAVNVLTKYEDEYGESYGEGEYADWWCVKDEAAYVGAQPVFLSMAWELRRFLGDEFYEQVAAYLEERRKGGVPVTIGKPSGNGLAKRVTEQHSDSDSAALAAYVRQQQLRAVRNSNGAVAGEQSVPAEVVSSS